MSNAPGSVLPPHPSGSAPSGPSRLGAAFLVGVIGLVLLMVVSGGGLQGLVGMLAPAATPDPASIPPGPQGWSLVAADTFDNNNARWTFVGHYTSIVGASDSSIDRGVYTWKLHADKGVLQESFIGQANPLTDVYFSAEIKLIDGNAQDAAYGIVFGYADEDNCLIYEIHTNQSGGAGRVLQKSTGEWFSLTRWINTPAIRPGAVNRIALQGDGYHFDFFANDQMVTQLDLDEMASGRVGLVVEMSPPSTDETVQFDNVAIYSPTPQAGTSRQAPVAVDFSPIGYVGIVLFAVLVVSRGVRLVQLVYLNSTRERRHEESASHLAIPIPAAGQAFAERLEALGFKRAGELQIRLPGVSQPVFEWVFFNPDGTIYVELVVITPPGTPAIQFNTRYPDDAIVETTLPIGENIRDSDYRASRVEGGVDAAYEYHRRQVMDFSMQHGSPRAMKSIDDMLIWSPIYRKKYMARRTWRTLTRLHLLPFAGECVAFASCVAMVLIAPSQASVVVPVTILALGIGLRYLLADVVPAILKRA